MDATQVFPILGVSGKLIEKLTSCDYYHGPTSNVELLKYMAPDLAKTIGYGPIASF
jgi:hypothetical protein